MSQGGARIPNAENAIIEPAKLRDYLLSAAHPVGKFKAGAIGSGPPLAAPQKPARAWAPSTYGQKYEVRAVLRGPSGTAVEVVSVWIVRSNESAPRFVTAYAGGNR